MALVAKFGVFLRAQASLRISFAPDRFRALVSFQLFCWPGLCKTRRETP